MIYNKENGSVYTDRKEAKAKMGLRGYKEALRREAFIWMYGTDDVVL